MIVVDILCIHSCLKILLYYRNTREVFFIMKKEGWLDRQGGRLLCLLHWKLTPLDYEFKTTGEKAPFIKIYQDVENFSRKYIAPAVRKQICGIRCFSEYEKKRVSAYLEFLEKRRLHRSFEILQILEIFKERMLRPRVILLSLSRWREELTAVYKGKGYNADFYSIFIPTKLQSRDKYVYDRIEERSLKHNSNILLGLFLLFSVARNIFSCFCGWIARVTSSEILPNIGSFDIAAIVPGYDRTEQFHDLYWKKGHRAKQHRTLAILFGVFDDDAYRRYGYLAERWVAFDGSAHSPHIFSAFYWLWPVFPGILFRNMTRLCREIFKRDISRHYQLHIVHLWIEMSKMESLFKIAGVKLLWSSVEGQSLMSLAGCLAINRLGGLSAGSTWSIYPFPNYAVCRNALDVWFAWGPHHAAILSQSGELSRTMVLCGYPGDFSIEKYLEKATNLRMKWKKRGRTRIIISYYDNISHHDDEFIYSSVIQFLKNVLLWVKKNQESLLVIKVKRKIIYEDYPLFITSLLRVLKSQKRIIWEYEKADLSAGFAADIVLGLGMGSLACLLGTYGKDVILFDDNKYNEQWGIEADTIAFISNPEDIIATLDKRHSGNYECYNNVDNETIQVRATANRLNSFTDGRSAERIGAYISDLVDSLKKKLEPQDAVLDANMRYRKRWDSEKIIEFEEFLKQ